MKNQFKTTRLATFFFLMGLVTLYFTLTGNYIASSILIVVSIILIVATLFYWSYDLDNENKLPIERPQFYPQENTYISKKTHLIWTIFDVDGTNAQLHRIKALKLNKNTRYIKEYQWGKGALENIQDITINGHSIETLSREGSRDVILIGLDKDYRKNDELKVEMVRKIKNGFTFHKEWVELLITTKTEMAIMEVKLPAERPFTYAYGVHKVGDYSQSLKIGEGELSMGEDSKSLKWVIENPVYNTFYTIVWEW